ncbi:hypothetical protein JAAARDRAFT_54113 [Jaapia argillacea MUCL 33604]|uniref:Uncharacterized protein n=1 Tax=Jaapia argillacea MUCL 33604 TaxID=933084 RepID=A0A067QF12_9AGAM|nr:hypothetical protein JAAARDRAFT_54113 [Jaapia argillacea MUCL 33604]
MRVTDLTPESSNKTRTDEFDALIDLLATDDAVAEGDASDAGVVLRDDKGKLDLGMIRSFFQSKHHDHKPSLAVPQPPPAKREVSSNAETKTSETPSCEVPPSQKIGTHSPTLQLPVPRERSRGLSQAVGVESEVREPLPLPGIVPLSFDEINQAIGCANGEVADLTRRCDQLRALISEKFLPDTPNRPALSQGPTTGDAMATTPSHQPSADVGGTSFSTPRLPPEISALTGDEARHALTVFTRSLSLPPSSITLLPMRPCKEASQGPSDVSDVQRALDFVTRVDEIIWKRAKYPFVQGANTGEIFSEENLEALIDRITLWDKVVRSRR